VDQISMSLSFEVNRSSSMRKSDEGFVDAVMTTIDAIRLSVERDDRTKNQSQEHAYWMHALPIPNRPVVRIRRETGTGNNNRQLFCGPMKRENNYKYNAEQHTTTGFNIPIVCYSQQIGIVSAVARFERIYLAHRPYTGDKINCEY
jgi:hypothetical protein